MTARKKAAGRGGRRRYDRASAVSPEAAVVEQLVSIERLAAGGRGVGRLLDGRVVFVPGGLPGDRVRVQTAHLKKSFAEAVKVEVVEPSPTRLTPSCADSVRCGGCDLMALPLDGQREAKLGILRDALERVARVDLERLELPLQLVGGEGLGYRNRVRLQVEGSRLGFFAPGSHDLVEVERCHVCDPALWGDVERLRSELRDEPALAGGAQQVEVRRLGGAERSSVHFFDGRASEESPERLFVTDDTYVLSPVGSFVQVNQAINRLLVQEVLQAAGELQRRLPDGRTPTFLDVYCGSGNFSLPLAHRGFAGRGVEVAGQAIDAARDAAREQSLDCEFVAGAAERQLRRLVADRARFDLIIVDPPRSGAQGLSSELATLCTGALIMVSCDPVTFARDLQELMGRGMRLRYVRAFDMFPQTHHVESFALLEPC